jgi:hypothetical protein
VAVQNATGTDISWVSEHVRQRRQAVAEHVEAGLRALAGIELFRQIRHGS